MSYEFTGRYSPSQLASGLQTYGSTGAAMSPEQNNPVPMPQNNQKGSVPTIQSWLDAGESFNRPLAYNGATYYMPNIASANAQAINNTGLGGGPKELKPLSDTEIATLNNTAMRLGLFDSGPVKSAEQRYAQDPTDMSSLLMMRNALDHYNLYQNEPTVESNDNYGYDTDTGQNNVWGDSLSGMDTNADSNVYNPGQFAAAMQDQRQQSDFYNQNGGWLKQGGMGGNDLGNVDTSTRYENGGMGGNDLGDVDLTKRQTPQVDYAFTGRTQSPEQNSPTEQKGNWLQNITRNPVNKDLATMASNLVMPGLGKIWGANTAPTYSISPNTTFGQKAAHVADNFVRNLPIVGTPYALATDLYRQSHASTDPYSRPAMQSEFEKWAPTVPYGNGMDMADPSYLQNQALAKAMADKGIGRQYSFTGRQ